MSNDDYTCGTCRKEFPAGRNARDQHCKATGHSIPRYKCDRCERCFNSDDACFQHMNDKNHFEWECNVCDETWPDEEQMKEHEAEEHNYCSDCDRWFQSYHDIQQHLRSRTHQGTNIACPFCDRKYATATGVAHHVESSSCPDAPQVDRDELYAFIRSKDPKGIISKKLIDWVGSSTFMASERTWNGYAYECYLCHRTFNQLNGLQQHLKSPIHQQALYHCPGIHCRREFVSLAAVINHLESETCGTMRFEKVQQRFGDIITLDRRIKF